MAAGLATLDMLRDEPPYERLESLSARLAEGSIAPPRMRVFRTSSSGPAAC